MQYSDSQANRITAQSGQDLPFNFTYLVGNNNDKVTFPSLGAVLEMVAQNVFLDFTSGFSQYKKLVRDNVSKHWASPDALGYPQNFMSFGLSSIEFPVERVLNACSARLAARLVGWWSNPTPAPSAMSDLIRTEILPGLFLAETEHDHQIIDSISMGDNKKALCQGSGRLGSQHPQAAQRPQHSLREPAAVHLQRAGEVRPPTFMTAAPTPNGGATTSRKCGTTSAGSSPKSAKSCGKRCTRWWKTASGGPNSPGSFWKC